MKKTLLILGLAGVMFTACDPVMDKGTYESTTITSENFLNGATFTQFDKVIADDGTESYVPSETGNYIQYDFSNVPAVTISYIDKNGETKVLSYGRAGGLFYYLPSRGSEPLQTLYFSYINADGTEVVAEKQFTLKVAQALEPAVEILVSDKGVKKWKWMPTEVNGGAVWGNGAYCEGEQDGSLAINGSWWGCGVEDGTCPDKFSGQMQHAGASYIAGEEYSTSKMVFNADQATITLFDKDGKQIRQGSYSVDLTPNPDKFSIETLNTSAGAILWPFAINQGGMEPTSFEIGYLGSDAMVLIFAPEGTDAYGECTWWSFGK